MTARLSALAQRIRSELADLERLVLRTQQGWRKAQQSSDDFSVSVHPCYWCRLGRPALLPRPSFRRKLESSI